jgi:uncharacterized protein involved in type VI secretion and phage assembly
VNDGGQIGVVIGKVQKLPPDDPDKLGRLKVQYTLLPGKPESHWAPVATLMSGKERGAWFMPEQGDEVVVAFEYGRTDSPYIVGFLWNGKQKPPEVDPKKRLLKSVKGHTFLLDDTDDTQKVELKSKNGHTFTLDDQNKKTVIASAAQQQHTISLDDDGKKLELKSGGGLTVTLDDSGSKIEISGGGRKVTMTSGKVQFT